MALLLSALSRAPGAGQLAGSLTRPTLLAVGASAQGAAPALSARVPSASLGAPWSCGCRSSTTTPQRQAREVHSSSSSSSSSGGGGGSDRSSSTTSSGGGGGGLGPKPRKLEPSAEEVRAAFAHCAQLVSEREAESLPWVVALPKDLRARVLAVRAFGLEVLMVGEAVRSRERALAALRFQWWRDAVGQLGGGAPPPAHPVLVALWAAGREARLGRYHLKRIVDAREEEFMRDAPPLTLEELEAHGEGTASQLLYLQLAAAGIASRDADHAASHLGKSTGITLALRGTPYQASQRRTLLPIEVCARHKVSQEEIYRGPPASEALRDATLELGAAAKAHLEEARALAPRLPRGAAPLLRQAVGVGEYLRALEAKGFDPFHPDLPAGGASPLRRALLVKWHALRGTY